MTQEKISKEEVVEKKTRTRKQEVQKIYKKII